MSTDPDDKPEIGILRTTEVRLNREDIVKAVKLLYPELDIPDGDFPDGDGARVVHDGNWVDSTEPVVVQWDTAIPRGPEPPR